jgi:hypothetical protein
LGIYSWWYKVTLQEDMQEELAYIIARAEVLYAVGKTAAPIKDLATAITYLKLAQTGIRNEIDQ